MPKTKLATHCLTELFPICQNKHWTIRRQDDCSVGLSSHGIILEIVRFEISNSLRPKSYPNTNFLKSYFLLQKWLILINAKLEKCLLRVQPKIPQILHILWNLSAQFRKNVWNIFKKWPHQASIVCEYVYYQQGWRRPPSVMRLFVKITWTTIIVSYYLINSFLKIYILYLTLF